VLYAHLQQIGVRCMFAGHPAALLAPLTLRQSGAANNDLSPCAALYQRTLPKLDAQLAV
jgi:hypothetical protein